LIFQDIADPHRLHNHFSEISEIKIITNINMVNYNTNRMVEYNYTFKICVYADKDESMEYFVRNILHEDLKEFWGMTIGAEFFHKDIIVNEVKIAKLQLWMHRNASTDSKISWGMYLKGSLGIILIHDLNDPKSLDRIAERITFIRNLHNDYQVPILLVGIKPDKNLYQTITMEQLDEFKEDHNIPNLILFMLEDNPRIIFKCLMKSLENVMPDFDESYFDLIPPKSTYS
jgi:GTPase SAR1 family protein